MKGRQWVLGVACGLACGCLGPTVGSVELPGLDREVEAKLPLQAGKVLSFPVHADSYEYSGGNAVVLDVTLLRSGREVARVACAGFSLDGGSGCGSGATELNSDCALRVPEGGSDTIRVVATLADPSNTATFEGLAVYIRD